MAIAAFIYRFATPTTHTHRYVLSLSSPSSPMNNYADYVCILYNAYIRIRILNWNCVRAVILRSRSGPWDDVRGCFRVYRGVVGGSMMWVAGPLNPNNWIACGSYGMAWRMGESINLGFLFFLCCCCCFVGAWTIIIISNWSKIPFRYCIVIWMEHKTVDQLNGIHIHV